MISIIIVSSIIKIISINLHTQLISIELIILSLIIYPSYDSNSLMSSPSIFIYFVVMMLTSMIIFYFVI
jgi:predicted membrane protein